MMTESVKSGIALLCDLDGRVVNVLADEFDIARDVRVGELFTQILDRASEEKALRFLHTIRTEGAAFGWELNLPIHRRMTSLHFVGAWLRTIC